MTARHVWRGRHGSVVLGETQHRVALALDGLTRHGRVTIRTSTIAERLGLERSEAYRITARLRALGLFGIEDDAGGSRGRRWWRTSRPDPASTLDPVRHRLAWSRVVASTTARYRAARARLAAITHPGGHPGSTAGRLDPPLESAGPSFAERMRIAGLGRLMDEWKVAT